MKNFKLLIACLLLSVAATAQVGIGTTSPNTSAALDIASTTSGLLVPRMTHAQLIAIALPATGLLVFQSDGTAGFYFNSGTPGAPVWTFIQNSANANVTLQGNIFNGASQLVQLNASTQLPAVSGVNLTNLNATNLASGTVATGLLGSGTASSTTFLRGDGTWNAPSGGSGATLDLVATNTNSQTIAISATTTVTFNHTTTSPTIGSFTGSNTYTVGATGLYMIQVSIAGTTNAAVSPVLSINGVAIRYGTGGASGAYASPFSRGTLIAILPLTAGNTVTIQGANGNGTAATILTTDGSTEVTIVKM